MSKARYYLRFCGRPLCDHMGCEAGRMLCDEAQVNSCNYRTLRDARAAMRRVNGLPGYAGAASISQGECPRVSEETR